MCYLMRSELGLSYKHVRVLDARTNKLRSLVLRQHYAIKMLELHAHGYRVLNVDESWLSETNYSRMTWSKRGRPNARSTKGLPQRIALVAAMDTSGAAYVALSTGKTDSDVIITFLSYLCDLLDLEDLGWRNKTVILLDNAAYHHSRETMRAMKKFGLRVIYSGPYSFTAAPVETFFAHLKTGDLNPLKLQLGKR